MFTKKNEIRDKSRNCFSYDETTFETGTIIFIKENFCGFEKYLFQLIFFMVYSSWDNTYKSEKKKSLYQSSFLSSSTFFVFHDTLKIYKYFVLRPKPVEKLNFHHDSNEKINNTPNGENSK